MTHDVQTMAYVGTQPWHGLGNRLPPKQSIDIWRRQAGFDWQILESPVRFTTGLSGAIGTADTYADHKVLYRSDTRKPLSVVSSKYQVVQPAQVLDFLQDLTEMSGYEMDTAGVLREGRRFYALAKTGQSTAIKGSDVIQGYLLLATSCDGSLATTATPTTIRVVCSNTLAIALRGAAQAVKISHRSSFDPQSVKRQLGIAVSQWDSFLYQIKMLAERRVKSHEAMAYFLRVFTENTQAAAPAGTLANERAIKKALSLYDGQGKGAELPSAKGTAWGLLNAVTEFVDHERRSRSDDLRQDSAWFGSGAAIKQRALDQAVQMIA